MIKLKNLSRLRIIVEEPEEWRNVKGYTTLYQVSNYGNIRAKGELKNISLYSQPYGHVVCSLKKRKIHTSFGVHRLVYQAFVGDLIKGLVIDHIDNDPTNNYYKNLQQITYRENSTKDKWRYDRSSNYVGVCFTKKGWEASILIKGVNFFIGVFNNEEAASDAYQDVLKNGKTDKYKQKDSPNRPKGLKILKVPVIQYDLLGNEIARFESMSEAGREVDSSGSVIGTAISNNNIVKGKWKFKKVN